MLKVLSASRALLILVSCSRPRHVSKMSNKRCEVTTLARHRARPPSNGAKPRRTADPLGRPQPPKRPSNASHRATTPNYINNIYFCLIRWRTALTCPSVIASDINERRPADAELSPAHSAREVCACLKSSRSAVLLLTPPLIIGDRWVGPPELLRA